MPRKSTKKNLILEIAKNSFSKHGYNGTSLGDIAAEAGIQKSSLYAHFQSKDDLFLYVFRNAHESSLSQIKAICADPSFSDEEKLFQIFSTTCNNDAVNIFRMSFYPLPNIQEQISSIFTDNVSQTYQMASTLFDHLKSSGAMIDRPNNMIFDLYVTLMNGAMFNIPEPSTMLQDSVAYYWNCFCEWSGLRDNPTLI